MKQTNNRENNANHEIKMYLWSDGMFWANDRRNNKKIHKKIPQAECTHSGK